MKKLWAALLLTAVLLVSCGGEKQSTLHVYNWDDYINDEVLRAFEKEFNCRIVYDTYASNEDLIAKLQAGATGYDVIFPSDYAVSILNEEKRLLPIDKSKLPNLRHVDSQFMNPPFDPGLTYSVPYTYGFSGIGYDTDVIDEVSSWDVFWNPELSGRMLLLDDMREVFGMAFKKLGYSINDTDPDHLAEASALLKEQKQLLRKYESTMSTNLLLTGEVALIHHWGGDVYQIMEEDSTIAFAIPDEGSILFTDCMCIPVTAPNPGLAHDFINFILRPEVTASLVNTIWYPMPNDAALQFIEEEIKSDPNIYPATETLRQSEFIRDLGDYTPVMERAWTELKMH